MRALMGVQVGRSIEGFRANAACVGFGGRVGQFVSGEIARLTKGSVANVADERFFARVYALEKRESQPR